MWILYALLASTSFGVAAVFQKLAAREPAQSSVWEVLLFQGIATIAIGAIGFLATRQSFTKQEGTAYLWAALTGVALTVGALLIFVTYRAADTAQADVSRIQALVNTNTLIAVILGLIVLREYTHVTTAGDWVRLIVGALLVVIGGILVSQPPKQPAADVSVRPAHAHVAHVHPHATHAPPHHRRAPHLRGRFAPPDAPRA